MRQNIEIEPCSRVCLFALSSSTKRKASAMSDENISIAITIDVFKLSPNSLGAFSTSTCPVWGHNTGSFFSFFYDILNIIVKYIYNLFKSKIQLIT